jgi:hypothetical protein
MIIMTCDVKNCSKKPYVEVYFKSSTCGKNNTPCEFGCSMHWSYLCFRHFVIDLIMNRIKHSGRGYCYVSDRKTLLGRLLDRLNKGELDEEVL